MSEIQKLVNNETHLLRADEVAKRLDISRTFAYLLMKQGEIPTVRLGRAVRVNPSDLEKYIKLNTINRKSNPTSHEPS